MTAALPLCVIGAGSIGARHIAVACCSDRVSLTAIVEPDPARRAHFADLGLPVVATPDDVPRETRAAIYATPTGAHHANVLDGLARGWAVLVEKPIAATVRNARAMDRAAQVAGLPLITGHHRRCHPFSQAARSAITELGDLVGVQGLWSLRKHDSYYDIPWRCQPGAGPLMTNLSHEIDLLRFLIGEITDVTALSSSARRGLEIEDTAAIAIRFENGALGSFMISDAGASPWSFEAATAENPAIAASHQDYVRIIGTQGALEFPALTRWTRSGPGEIEWSKPLKRQPGASFPKVDPLLEQINRFAALANGAEDDILCTPTAATAALEITLAVALSAKSGRPVRAGEVPEDYTGI